VPLFALFFLGLRALFFVALLPGVLHPVQRERLFHVAVVGPLTALQRNALDDCKRRQQHLRGVAYSRGVLPRLVENKTCRSLKAVARFF